jgi:hypothetical protein
MPEIAKTVQRLEIMKQHGASLNYYAAMNLHDHERGDGERLFYRFNG